MKNIRSNQKMLFVLMGLVLIVPFFLSCQISDDDDTTVTVCNLDDRKYDVELRKNSDDTVVDELRVEEWYTLGDQCDTSKDVDEGRYYLVVFDDDGITDESNDFYLDDGESLSFEIHGSGDIVRNFNYEDYAVVSVCNSADKAYRVALKRSSDDGLVEDFDLLDCHDFENIDPGRYHIEIYAAGDNQRTARSDDFFLGPHTDESFTVTQTGALVNHRLQ